MNRNDKNTPKAETILMALDQISQTIEVMTSVVGRLRTHVQQQLSEDSKAEQRELREDLPANDRIIH